MYSEPVPQGSLGIKDGEHRAEEGARPRPFRKNHQEQTRIPATIRVGEYEISDGRLLHHDYHPFRGKRTVVVGDALYVWPNAGDEGFWCEGPRGGFGLSSIGEMISNAWADATFTVIRRYGPEHGAVKAAVGFIWQCWYHRLAATPYGAFEAGSPEAMKALEAYANRRGCSND